MSGKNTAHSDAGMFYLLSILGLLMLTKIVENSIPAMRAFLYQHQMIVSLSFGLLCSLGVYVLWNKVEKKIQDKKFLEEITNGKSEDAVFAGYDKAGKPVHINLSSRRMHTQVIGTTNAGKTESVIIPWAVDDISKDRGLLLLDGKSDESLLNKIYAYATKYNRAKSFKYFSLTSIETSHTFNPLMGGSTEEIAERVFGAFQFESEYYRGVQYEIFSQVLRIFASIQEIPTFLKLHQAISNPVQLKPLVDRCKDKALSLWGNSYLGLKADERDKRTSGLLSQISSFAFGETAVLFNTECPTIDIESALKNDEAIYFQLPVLKFPTLGKATGKLVLQVLQSAVSSRHKNGSQEHKFFSCYLDDFSEFLPKSFISLLNKSRSANVGITFAHQALGDLKALGPDAENTILVNSNLKVFMRTNEPESAEYFAKVVGTREAEKSTERQTKNLGMKQKTGEASIRVTEEFIYHPNSFKKDMGVGEAVVVIPHNKGSQSVRLKFSILPNLTPVKLPLIPKLVAASLYPASEMPNDAGSFVATGFDKPNIKEVA